MPTVSAPGVDELIQRLDAAVRLDGVDAVAHRVKDDLTELLCRGLLQLPAAFRVPRPDTYARRLLHRDPATGYTVIVMTWGVGQRTPLHDHAGIWCVEGVVEGQMEVTQYDVVERKDERYCFRREGAIAAGVGSAGCLIPPYEYHMLANARADRPSITLHVYGGEMRSCNIFAPIGDGWYERQTRPLSYHD
jgi:predicted metal-dependent enzyme (double-stranded beta helix superfamily)